MRRLTGSHALSVGSAQRVPVAVRLLHPDATVPAYSTDGDAGADLTSVADVTLDPGERALVPTGVAPGRPMVHYHRAR